MRRRAIALATLAAASLSPQAPQAAEPFWTAPVQPGVYECYDQTAMPSPNMMFGLVDDTTYKNYDGQVGEWRYDSATARLEVGYDRGAPALFTRVSETSFRALNADGSLAGFVCPLNPAKDPNAPPW